MEDESKLVVPNKWDNYGLDLYISIGELVEPLHKKNFQNSSFLPPLILVVIISIYIFLGIVYKMYVIIDDFVYFDHFFYAN